MKIVLRSLLSGILFIIILALCLRLAMGSTHIPTFSGFLETLANVPQVAIPFLSDVTSGALSEPWIILDGFRVFLMTLLQIIDVLIFAVNGLLSVITYVIYFFRWLFIFV